MRNKYIYNLWDNCNISEIIFMVNAFWLSDSPSIVVGHNIFLINMQLSLMRVYGIRCTVVVVSQFSSTPYQYLQFSICLWLLAWILSHHHINELMPAVHHVKWKVICKLAKTLFNFGISMICKPYCFLEYYMKHNLSVAGEHDRLNASIYSRL